MVVSKAAAPAAPRARNRGRRKRGGRASRAPTSRPRPRPAGGRGHECRQVPTRVLFMAMCLAMRDLGRTSIPHMYTIRLMPVNILAR